MTDTPWKRERSYWVAAVAVLATSLAWMSAVSLVLLWRMG